MMYQYLGSTDILLYTFFGSIGTFALLLFNLLHYKQKKECLGLHSQNVLSFIEVKVPRLKVLISIVLTVVEIYWISFFQYAFPANFNRPFGDLVGTGLNYFGLLYSVPFILLLFCILMRINPLKQIDLITPAFPLALIFAKIGCFCAGCCRGIECSWGLYNHVSNLNEFPVQLVEASLALAIFIFLLYWRKKAKPGTMFPTYLILYSGTRFFSEFLRHEPEVFWIFKTYHILCIIGVIVGLAELFLVLKFGDKISKFDIFRPLAKPFGRVKLFFKRKFGDKIRKRKDKKERRQKKRH